MQKDNSEEASEEAPAQRIPSANKGALDFLSLIGEYPSYGCGGLSTVRLRTVPYTNGVETWGHFHYWILETQFPVQTLLLFQSFKCCPFRGQSKSVLFNPEAKQSFQFLIEHPPDSLFTPHWLAPLIVTELGSYFSQEEGTDTSSIGSPRQQLVQLPRLHPKFWLIAWNCQLFCFSSPNFCQVYFFLLCPLPQLRMEGNPV